MVIGQRGRAKKWLGYCLFRPWSGSLQGRPGTASLSYQKTLLQFLPQSRISNIQSLLPPLASLRPLATFAAWFRTFLKESALRGRIALPVREPRIKMSDSREEAASSSSVLCLEVFCLLPQEGRLGGSTIFPKQKIPTLTKSGFLDS